MHILQPQFKNVTNIKMFTGICIYCSINRPSVLWLLRQTSYISQPHNKVKLQLFLTSDFAISRKISDWGGPSQIMKHFVWDCRRKKWHSRRSFSKHSRFLWKLSVPCAPCSTNIRGWHIRLRYQGNESHRTATAGTASCSTKGLSLTSATAVTTGCSTKELSLICYN